MFCDLVDSTELSQMLGPEDLREAVRAYQQTCTEVIRRFEGHIAQYLGDGLLVYFGYPQAHEDDAVRAVSAALGLLEELQRLNDGLRQRLAALRERPLQIRVAVHTGPVVVGEMGGGERRQQLALGDTVNIAARLQDLAQPDSVVISAATRRLVRGVFVTESLGPGSLKGIADPRRREERQAPRRSSLWEIDMTPILGH